jgi:hypothetical protein
MCAGSGIAAVCADASARPSEDRTVTAILLLLVGVLVLGIAGAAAWQHFRYLRARRDRLEDRQPLFYPKATFHAIMFLKVAEAKRREGELETLRALRAAIEGPGGGEVVYAGLAPLTLAESAQIENDWSGVLIAQYPSRDAFERGRKTPALEQALAACEYTHVHGFERPMLTNLIMPLGLGAIHLLARMRCLKPVLPFEPVKDEDATPEFRTRRKELLRFDLYRDVREDAIMMINLVLHGTAEQRAADDAYTGEMGRGMAEGGYGPMHMGRAITVQGDSRFHMFAAVFYPGIDHMHAMLGSAFFNQIASGKQLGDTIAMPTVPVLSKL